MGKIINSVIAIIAIAGVLLGTSALIALMHKGEYVVRQKAMLAEEKLQVLSLLPPDYRGQKQTLFTIVAEGDTTCMEMLNASTETCFQLMRQTGRNVVKSGEVWHIIMADDNRLYVMME